MVGGRGAKARETDIFSIISNVGGAGGRRVPGMEGPIRGGAESGLYIGGAFA